MCNHLVPNLIFKKTTLLILVLKEERRPRDDRFIVTWVDAPPPRGHYGDYGSIGLRETGESRIIKYPRSVQQVHLHILFPLFVDKIV